MCIRDRVHTHPLGHDLTTTLHVHVPPVMLLLGEVIHVYKDVVRLTDHTYPASLHALGEHDNVWQPSLPNHPPEVTDSVWHGTL